MSGINQKVFGKLDDGKDVNLFELVNKNGMKVEVRNQFVKKHLKIIDWNVVQVLDYGATIRAIKVLDKHGHEIDVALGFDSMDWYLGYGICVIGFVCCWDLRVKVTNDCLEQKNLD